MEKLSKSLEDYIEAVYVLEEKYGVARISELSASLGVKKPSAAAAVKILKGKKLVEHERYGYIKLTPLGREMAKWVLSSHNSIKEFLCEILGVCEKDASRQACEMEHILTPDTQKRMTRFLRMVKSRPGVYEKIKDFREKHHGNNNS